MIEHRLVKSIMTRFIKLFVFSYLMIPFSLQAEQASIVYINSYHAGYQWTDKGFTAFKNSLKVDADIHLLYLDSKRNQSPKYMKQVTQTALKFIDQHQPDIIIAAEDNASKFIIEPYFKNAEIPVIFLGVNLDATPYGYPYINATGIIEMDGIKNLIKALKAIKINGQFSMLFTPTNTSQKKKSILEKTDLTGLSLQTVNTDQQWYDAISKNNDFSDFLALDTISGISGLTEQNALNYIKENVTQPIITASYTSRNLAHIGYVNIAEEHGTWAANVANEVLSGKDIASFPIHKSSHYLMFINQKLIDEMNITIPQSIYQLPHVLLKRLQ